MLNNHRPLQVFECKPPSIYCRPKWFYTLKNFSQRRLKDIEDTGAYLKYGTPVTVIFWSIRGINSRVLEIIFLYFSEIQTLYFFVESIFICH